MSDLLNVAELKEVLHVLAQTNGRSDLHQRIDDLDLDPNAAPPEPALTPEQELEQLRARNRELEAAAVGNRGNA